MNASNQLTETGGYVVGRPALGPESLGIFLQEAADTLIQGAPLMQYPAAKADANDGVDR